MKFLKVDTFYEQEGLSYVHEGEVRDNRFRIIVNVMKSQNVARHLDVGCACGHYCEAISKEFPFVQTVGVDIARSKLATGKKRVHKLQFVASTWDFLPFIPGSFDLITFFEGLEHTIQPDRTLREIKQQLSANGCLIVSCPVSTPMMIIPEMAEVTVNRLLFSIFGFIFRGHLNWFLRPKIYSILKPHFKIEIYSTNMLNHFPVTRQLKILVVELLLKPLFYFMPKAKKIVNAYGLLQQSLFTAFLVLENKQKG